MTTGKLYVIEGCDGTGKSTLTRKLVAQLTEFTDELYVERSIIPNTPLCRDLKNKSSELIFNSPERQLLLAAANVIGINKIRVLLNSGVNVICDRWIYSAAIYGELDKDQNLVNVTKKIFDLQYELTDIVPTGIIILTTDDINFLAKRIIERDSELSHLDSIDRLQQISDKYLTFPFDKYCKHVLYLDIKAPDILENSISFIS